MGNKYPRLQISIYWLASLLAIIAYYTVEFRGLLSHGDRPFTNMIHISCGISILILVVVRLLLRLKCPAPPIIPKSKPMMTRLAHSGHLVIHLLFIAPPVIGLVMIYNRGNLWSTFGLTMPYISGADSKRIDSLKSWHETLADLGYLATGLHAAAALAHHCFWKDDTLLRIISRKCS